MRARTVVCGLAILVLGVSGVVSADTTIYDDFPGTSLNLTNWQVQDATTPGVSGSNVNFSTSGAWQEINSTGSWNPATTTFEFKYAGGSGTQTFGLGDYPIVTEGYGSIEVKNTSGSWKFVNTKFLSSGTTYESPAFTAPVAGDVFDIAYISSNQHMDLSKNGEYLTTVPVDLTKITPGLLNFYGGVEYASSTMSLDYVGTIANVPEPSTVVLLSVGVVGLLAYAWRKRR